MPRILTAAAFGLMALGLSACSDPYGTRDPRLTGATVGAVGGGVAGNLLGGDSRSTLIGAGLGAATGAVVAGQRQPRY